MLMEFVADNRLEVIPIETIERLQSLVYADGVPEINLLTSEVIELRFDQAQDALVALDKIRAAIISGDAVSVECAFITIRGRQ